MQVDTQRDEISLVIPEPLAEVLHLSYTSPEKFYEVKQVKPKQTISDVTPTSTIKPGMSEELGMKDDSNLDVDSIHKEYVSSLHSQAGSQRQSMYDVSPTLSKKGLNQQMDHPLRLSSQASA